MRRAIYIAGATMSASAWGQNLIVNGGFEQGNYIGGPFVMLGPNSTTLPGWQVGSEGGVRWCDSSMVSPAEEQRSLELNEQSPSSIAQSVATTIGASYRLRFAFAGDPYGLAPIRTMSVFVGATRRDFEFNILGFSFSNMGWREEAIDFVAAGSSTLIRFQSTSPSFAGPFIDQIILEPTRPTCVADVDDGTGTGTPDGGVTVDDLLYYLVVFEGGVPDADVDDGSGAGVPDGGVTIDDLLYYLLRFEQGC
jgi:choice-of-anchor C domain-containing protein